MAVDVGSAVGYLDLDIKGFLNNLRSAQDEAGKASKGISDKLASAGDGLNYFGDKISGMGSILSAGITAPLVTAVTASVNSFAELEQNLGGSEAVYGEWAKNVQKTAEEAYKNMGSSQSEYLANVNKMGSLFQGSGIEVQRSMELSEKALQRAADVASVMGIDTAAAFESVTGAAKGNYTMMDNLGVSMSATSIQQYALQKGLVKTEVDMDKVAKAQEKVNLLTLDYEKAMIKCTEANGKYGAKSEQARKAQIDMEKIQVKLEGATRAYERSLEASTDSLSGWWNNLSASEKAEISMQMFFEKTEKYAGNFARESTETISGAFGMLKSSFTDFLAGLGNPDADIDKLVGNIMSSVEAVAGKLKEVLSTIWDNIPLEEGQKKMIAFAAAFGPGLIAVGKLTSGLGNMFKTFAEMPQMLSSVKGGFSAISTAMGGISAGPIIAIVAIIAVLALAFKNLWENNEEFRTKMIEIWDGIKEKIDGFLQGFVDRINALGFDFENITEVLKAAWDGFCAFLAPVFEGVFAQISNILGTVLDVILQVFDVWVSVFNGDWEGAWNGIKEVYITIWEGIKESFSIAMEALKGIADVVLGWFGTSWDEVWTSIKDFFVDTWNSICDFFSDTVENIKNFFKDIWDAIVKWATDLPKKATEAGQNFSDNINKFFEELPYNIGRLIGLVIGNVATWAVNMAKKAEETGKQFSENIAKFFSELPGNLKKWFDNAWENLKKWGKDTADKASETGEQFIKNVGKFFSTLPEKVAEWFTNTMKKVSQWAEDMKTKGKKASQEFLDNVVEGAANLPDKIYQIGKNIVSGIWQGILNAKDKFVEDVKGFFSGIIDGIEASLQINSPSKIMAKRIGSPMIEGVAYGFKKAMPEFMKDMQDSLDKGIDSMDANEIPVDLGTDGYTDSMKQALNGLSVWFESVESRIGRSIKNMSNEMTRFIQLGNSVAYNGSLGGFGPKETGSAFRSQGGVTIQKLEVNVDAKVSNGYDTQTFAKDLGVSIDRELRSKGVMLA